MSQASEDLNAALFPPRMVLYAYALSSGVGDYEKFAAALCLEDAPGYAAEAWEAYAAAETYAPLEVVCEEYRLNPFLAFVVNLAFAAELDEAIRSVANALGGGLTAAFATRLFSSSAQEAVNWRANWLASERTLTLLFEESERLALQPVILRFLLGAEGRETLPFHLEKLALRVNAAFAWDDLILPAAQKSALRYICDRVRFDQKVYGEWGFGGKTPYGRGVRALFSGPPGTGKTMAAQVVAGELGLPLYRVDVSALVSKYIGETEKNLSDVFKRAAQSEGILFFDEADSMFGKRGEQKDSHDKYANMQTGFLLQQVEDYAGIVLLATNLLSNIDAAFMRRIQIRVDFPVPDHNARLIIWRNLLKEPAPIAPDADAELLAANFELSGSEIKNIVLAAAFLAAPEGGGISMRHLVRALAMEYAKTDKILSAKDLGEYADELG